MGVMFTEPIDMVAAPPSLTHVQAAYAFAIFSDAMEPRYFVGEIVHVHPGIPARAGDFVLFGLTDGTVCIARLDPSHDDRCRFRILSPRPEYARSTSEDVEIEDDGHVYAIPRTRVAYVHKIVGSASS